MQIRPPLSTLTRTAAAAVAFLAVVIAAVIYLSSRTQFDKPGSTTHPLKKVVIAEAVRTLLYAPLYHAIEKGYFKDAGLDVEVITAGTATNAVASLLSGEADFAQADPMYVPISNEKGSDLRVVAQIVGRIAVWGVSTDPNLKEITASTLAGRTISTHKRPMTAYTYTLKTIRDAGLNPDSDVEILQNVPGTELAPLFNGQASIAMTLEPGTSSAVAKGAHVVVSYPVRLGDQVFTGIMTRKDVLSDRRNIVEAVVGAYQRSLRDIRANPHSLVTTTRKYFPNLSEPVLRTAVSRLVDEDVFPESVLISEKSWNKAINERVLVGDLTRPFSRAVSCDVEIMQHAIDLK